MYWFELLDRQAGAHDQLTVTPRGESAGPFFFRVVGASLQTAWRFLTVLPETSNTWKCSLVAVKVYYEFNRN